MVATPPPTDCPPQIIVFNDTPSVEYVDRRFEMPWAPGLLQRLENEHPGEQLTVYIARRSDENGASLMTTVGVGVHDLSKTTATEHMRSGPPVDLTYFHTPDRYCTIEHVPGAQTESATDRMQDQRIADLQARAAAYGPQISALMETQRTHGTQIGQNAEAITELAGKQHATDTTIKGFAATLAQYGDRLAKVEQTQQDHASGIEKNTAGIAGFGVRESDLEGRVSTLENLTYPRTPQSARFDDSIAINRTLVNGVSSQVSELRHTVQELTTTVEHQRRTLKDYAIAGVATVALLTGVFAYALGRARQRP